MKLHASTSPPRRKAKLGFSLIVTVTMLVLLSLIAIGLLSLSSTVLRGAQGDAAMAEARANARLALNLAVGELQKHAGPDTRVTARADILQGNVANPYLTGVWESWPIDANSPPSSNEFSQSSKEDKLLSWLVSGAPESNSITNQFAKNSLSDQVTLWGDASLGQSTGDNLHVKASRVELNDSNGSNSGSYAWAILDEGVKARVNTLTNERDRTTGDKLAQLGSGVRPSAEFIEGLENIRSETFEKDSEDSEVLAKSVTTRNFELAAEKLAGTDSDTAKGLMHDITLFSKGVLSNTAHGGLRTDFSLFAAQPNIPSIYSPVNEEYASLDGSNVYETLLGMSGSERSSSPRWNALFDFARLHEDGITKDNNVPLVSTTSPRGWQAAEEVRSRTGTTYVLNEAPPEDLVLMPTIAKVQMIFSLVGRDLFRQPRYAANAAPIKASQYPVMHNPQANHFKDTNYNYDLHLLYTPVVVLHNPYSVALEFQNLKVEFHHIPFALQVFRNGAPQSRDLVPFETMFADNDTEGKSKVFGMTLKTNRSGRPGSTNFQMLPGEVILFSPYLSPRLTYQSNFSGGRQNWDIYVGDNKTANLDAMPGWRGDGIGFDCDWLAGALKIDGNAANGRWSSCFGLSPDDKIHAEFAPFSSTSSDNKFLVTMSATPTGSRTPSVVNAIEIDYGSAANLRETILGNRTGTLRFPAEGTVDGRELLDWSGTPISDMENVKPLAVLSLQAKTTHGGYNSGSASQIDGRVAAKPWAFAHGSVGASSADLLLEHPSAHSHEIDLQPLTLGEGTRDIIEVQGERGNFITGHSSFNGSKFGVSYEIPVTPLQSLSTLNGANPGGISNFLPRFAAPIGNSWAHPLLLSNAITQTAPRGYQMLDHSFLMNLAFYDQFYFSGLGSQTGPFGNGRSTADSIREFSELNSLTDDRLQLYNPSTRDTSELEELANDELAHEKIAAWQMMEGAFNVNSTSVKAWKAMLASIHAPDALLNELSPSNSSSSLEELGSTGSGETRLSRLRVPLSRSAEDGGEDRSAYWLAPREYTEAQIEVLAENIVEQVKQRGPFLSLAEFVNRQLGNDELAMKGALQAAIDLANLNEEVAQQATAGYEIDRAEIADYKYSNTEAAAGASYQGAPGYLTQADLLNTLGNAATARSDTFVVRGMGESRNKAGKVLASAVCEAVVQRYPEWLDSRDAVETKPADLTSDDNERFGRRFRVVSFRWLSQDEV
ncbi:hypothetical protein [Roseibacillus persicicus]|uniref:Uncharacterized protein n=1 Tax=Roseibacillus persicicus TaxID=454148 RepID=A0A918WFV2_9BACT|nr:hypothetical protein [Roseibacillus persicicus]GHC40253.1 hypothetical protein GCM10007100_00810 [Roseibacillus persicicus]